jgi:hypothetical protein
MHTRVLWPEGLLFLLGPVSTKSLLPVRVLGLPDDDIPDDVLIECELAFAFLPDIEKMIVSMGCRAPSPRREDTVLDQSTDVVDQGYLQAGRHVQSFSLSDVPERVVNSATSQASFLLLSMRGIVEPITLPFIKAKKPRLELHQFLTFLSHPSQTFSLNSIVPSTSGTGTHHTFVTS